MSIPFQPAGDDANELRLHAKRASGRAYAPYSRFRVGAALRFVDGGIVTGCNVENASYGLTICAERTALVRAIAEGRSPADIDVIAVHVDGSDGQPCGMCRQFIAELAPQATVAFVAGGAYVEGPVSSLLPAAFTPGALGS